MNSVRADDLTAVYANIARNGLLQSNGILEHVTKKSILTLRAFQHSSNDDKNP